MQVPILQGMYSSGVDYRSYLPRNMVPVPKGQGISDGYLRPAFGIDSFATGVGNDRGAYKWNGECYRVSGESLIKVASDGTVTVLGSIYGSEIVAFSESFDVLSISGGGSLYYWDGTTLTQNTDPDLGNVVDHEWVDGYFMSTDGEFLIVTELNDRYSVVTTKYGSSEISPDPILSIWRPSSEVYALNRYTIEAFQNVGGTNFPFQRIPGAQVKQGTIGTRMNVSFAGSIAFVGSGRNEPPSVYIMSPGDAVKIATRDIETILAGYSEDVLAQCSMEAMQDKANNLLKINLPDQTLVYDAAASAALSMPVWYQLDSGLGAKSRYAGQNAVWCYDKWIVADPASSRIGALSNAHQLHYGSQVSWEFHTPFIYAEGGGVIQELELVCLTGAVTSGNNPFIYTDYSVDGETWSLPLETRVGALGERGKRIAWRRLGRVRHQRIHRFYGSSDAFISVTRLDAKVEPLNG
jgi:hypothetical protein